MSSVDELMKEAEALDPQERVRLFRRLLRLVLPDAGDESRELSARRVERHSSVCGGDACIAGTRIPVWVLEQMRRLGMSEADILRSYPSLRAEDLVHAWSYASNHPEEIEQQIRANEEN